MLGTWEWHHVDEEFSNHIQKRLPDTLFDVHAHLYHKVDLGEEPPEFLASGPEKVGLREWRERVGRQVGAGRLGGGLFFPFPAHGCDFATVNDRLTTEIAEQKESRGLMLVSPAMRREEAEATLANSQIIGFKPYHVFADVDYTFDAALSDFLPEWCWQLADDHCLIILIHLAREKSLNDEGNCKDLLDLCTRYPGAKVVLAHAARGFQPANTIDGLPALARLQNLWFDSSGICEPAALVAILKTFGPRRLLWGSDLPVSELRGKCVSIGQSFAWINPDRVDKQETSPALSPTLVGLESTSALLDAMDHFCCNEEDWDDIFCNNARRLVGILKEDGNLTQALYEKGKALIPGGTHLLSKRPEMFAPGQWPAYHREARGCEIWDMDGRHYYDMSINGIGSNLLGARDPDVTRAVQRRINLGSMSSVNPAEEVELAERLIDIHPWAERVRMARTGGEIAAVAVRIARATTERPLVAICGYHGWADWYLAANLGDSESLRGHLLPGLDPHGVPSELRGTTIPFTYNNREELQKIVDEHGDRLAAVVMEPCRAQDPEPGFLEFVRHLTKKNGTILIFDEITIGWRLHYGGAHLRFGINPDMALFAKTIGNGHPIAAVVGTSEAMEGANRSFISSSYWTEGVGPTAAIATLKKMKEAKVTEHVARIGTLIQDELRKVAAAHSLPVNVHGYPCAPSFVFEHEEALALNTLYVQEMLAEGFIAGPLIYVTLVHDEEMVEKFAAALDPVFGKIAAALGKGDIKAALHGPVAHGGFRRLIQ